MFKKEVFPYVGKRVSVLVYYRHGNRCFTGCLSGLHRAEARIDFSKEEQKPLRKYDMVWVPLVNILGIEEVSDEKRRL